MEGRKEGRKEAEPAERSRYCEYELGIYTANDNNKDGGDLFIFKTKLHII